MLRYIVYYLGAVYVAIFKYRLQKGFNKILEEDRRGCWISGVVIVETFIIFKILEAIYEDNISLFSGVFIILLLCSVTYYFMKE